MYLVSYRPSTILNPTRTRGIILTYTLHAILDFVENSCLKAHNERRALHGASPLIWDDTLVKHAQVWADHLAVTAKLRHDPDLDEEGENLAWFQGRLIANCTDALVGWSVNGYWHFGLKVRFSA